MKVNKDIVVCLRFCSSDIKAIKDISRKISYLKKVDIKYTDIIRDAVREKVHNENNKKVQKL